MVKRALIANDLLSSLNIRDQDHVVQIRKVNVFVRILKHNTTLKIISQENNEYVPQRIHINQKKSFLEEIYEILEIPDKTTLFEIELKSATKLRELDKMFNEHKDSEFCGHLRDILEKGELELIEEILTPEDLSEWLQLDREDIDERVKAFYNYCDSLTDTD